MSGIAPVTDEAVAALLPLWGSLAPVVAFGCRSRSAVESYDSGCMGHVGYSADVFSPNVAPVSCSSHVARVLSSFDDADFRDDFGVFDVDDV